jgi:hypothetical protein
MATLSFYNKHGKLEEYGDVKEVEMILAQHFSEIEGNIFSKKFSVELDDYDNLDNTNTFLDGFSIGDEVLYSETNIINEILAVRSLVKPVPKVINNIILEGSINLTELGYALTMDKLCVFVDGIEFVQELGSEELIEMISKDPHPSNPNHHRFITDDRELAEDIFLNTINMTIDFFNVKKNVLEESLKFLEDEKNKLQNTGKSHNPEAILKEIFDDKTLLPNDKVLEMVKFAEKYLSTMGETELDYEPESWIKVAGTETMHNFMLEYDFVTKLATLFDCRYSTNPGAMNTKKHDSIFITHSDPYKAEVASTAIILIMQLINNEALKYIKDTDVELHHARNMKSLFKREVILHVAKQLGF